MRYRLILPIALLLVAVCAVPAAQAKVIAGLSEQNPAMFDQKNWQQLKLKRVRYIVSWNYAKQAFERAEVSGFMNAAHAHKQDVLVSFSAARGCFNGKYSKKKSCKAPSQKAYKAAVKGFRKEFPYAKTFAAWNEVNHVSQPTSKSPKLAAAYYKSLKSVCKGCKVEAADLLDQSNLKSYVRRFLKASHGAGRIWGLHNYKDVNRHQSKGVRGLLSAVKGQVWLTETGGIVQFKASGFSYSLKRAAKSTKYMFSLARKYKRIKRIYVYRWFGENRQARFDAGLVNPNGSARPAFTQFKKSVKGLPR
jgi:hypothetical protein